MKNLFAYYKGYKRDERPSLHKSSLYMAYFLMGLMVLTLPAGVFAILVALKKGKTFGEILSTSPLVFYMTIASLPVFLLLLLYVLSFRRRERKEKRRLEIPLYIEDGDGFLSITSDFYEDSLSFMLELNRKYYYPRKDITGLEERDGRLYVFLGDSYFITDPEMKVFFLEAKDE